MKFFEVKMTIDSGPVRRWNSEQCCNLKDHYIDKGWEFSVRPDDGKIINPNPHRNKVLDMEEGLGLKV